MLHIIPLNQGKEAGTIQYSIWSEDWKRVHNVDLNKEQFKQLTRRKKKIEVVSWMQVLAQSDDEEGTGQYATDTETLKELNN